MSKTLSDHEWAPFNADMAANAGYLYTTNASLSSRIANLRHSNAILAFADFRGKRVIDIGCGDGTYTVELFDRGQPSSIYAIDPASNAIDIARGKVGVRNITYDVQSAYDIPRDENSFDIACLRGVLHHMDRPTEALQQAFRLASKVVLLEPNGYNIVLKLIEKLSKYHREHGEKSYPPAQIDRWVGDHGGKVRKRAWVCPVLAQTEPGR